MRYCVGSVQYTDPTQEIRVRSCRINEHELNHRDQEVRIDDQSVHCEKKKHQTLKVQEIWPQNEDTKWKGNSFRTAQHLFPRQYHLKLQQSWTFFALAKWSTLACVPLTLKKLPYSNSKSLVPKKEGVQSETNWSRAYNPPSDMWGKQDNKIDPSIQARPCRTRFASPTPDTSVIRRTTDGMPLSIQFSHSNLRHFRFIALLGVGKLLLYYPAIVVPRKP